MSLRVFSTELRRESMPSSRATSFSLTSAFCRSAFARSALFPPRESMTTARPAKMMPAIAIQANQGIVSNIRDAAFCVVCRCFQCHRGDDRRSVDGDGERHDLEVLECFAVIAELKVPGHETGFFELGEVHVEEGPGHADASSKFTDVKPLPRQQCDDSHPLVAGDGSERGAEVFCCCRLVHVPPPGLAPVTRNLHVPDASVNRAGTEPQRVTARSAKPARLARSTAAGKAARSASTSSSVEVWPSVKRKAPSASDSLSPMPTRTWDASGTPAWQAEPVLTDTPAPSSRNSSESP